MIILVLSQPSGSDSSLLAKRAVSASCDLKWAHYWRMVLNIFEFPLTDLFSDPLEPKWNEWFEWCEQALQGVNIELRACVSPPRDSCGVHHAGGDRNSSKGVTSETKDLAFHRLISQMVSTTSRKRGMLHVHCEIAQCWWWHKHISDL